MSDLSHLTTGQVAEFFRVPAWRIRRIVDSLAHDIPRVGLYRMIPRDVLPAIAAKLQGQQSEGSPKGKFDDDARRDGKGVTHAK